MSLFFLIAVGLRGRREGTGAVKARRGEKAGGFECPNRAAVQHLTMGRAALTTVLPRSLYAALHHSDSGKFAISTPVWR